jgi:two-component system, NtrC family, response regulator AtoC
VSNAAQPQRFDALVVDDERAIREVLVDFLHERGWRVASAGDGRAAVTALERSGGSCRMVFADISIPGADGFAVLNAARAANPATYVVMITGYGSLETAITAVRLGAQDYLTKPFSLGQVDVVLKQAAARFALEQERRRKADREVVTALNAIEERLSSIERLLNLQK